MQNSNNPPSVSVSERLKNGKNNGHLNGGVIAPEQFAKSTAKKPPITYHTLPRPHSLRMQYRFLRSLAYAGWLMARLLFWYYFVERVIGAKGYIERTNMERWRQYAREFRHFAIAMGGVMIKLGQFISTRVDVLPSEIIQELEGLQDEVPSVPYSKILAVIESELGTVSARYQWIDEKPVAAASLGQVHRAKLLNGDRVVIKVQRPGIDHIVYTDLRALKIVTAIAMRFRFVNRRADTRALAEEFGRVLLEELSYEHEARNAARFADIFKNDMGVYVPSFYLEHSTDRVLTIEDVTTIKITDYAAMEAAGINRKVVASRLMNTYLKQVFDERFFHADPHPGNLFVYPLPVDDEKADFGTKGRPFYLIFIDFGMTGILSEKITTGLVNTLGAVLSRDARKLVESYSELGFLLPGADLDRIEEATAATFNRVWGLSMAEIRDIDFDEMAALGNEFNDLLYDMPFYVPQDFIYLGRAVGILSGMCTSLDPAFNPWRELQAHSQKLIMQTVIKSDGLPGFESLFNGTGLQTLFGIGQTIITRAINPGGSAQTALLERAERGDLKFQVDPGQKLQMQLARLETQERRTTRAMIFGSLLISSTLLYTHGDIVPAIIGYVISGYTFLSLIFSNGDL
jgi:predicted unusual protein kinase regulating ubiquinone biosynthesis (AarF/ABC1/UbiB family)